MPLACLFFASVHAFFRYLGRPSPSRLALCAAATALAIVSKHSGILLPPVLVLLAIAHSLLTPKPLPSAIPSSPREGRLSSRHLALALGAIFLVSYVTLWGIYGFRYAARPSHLQMMPSLAAYAGLLAHPAQKAAILFLGGHHLLPEAYLYGWTDILLIPGSRSTFLFGRLFASGLWVYFPALFLIKSTLTLLVLLVLLPFARIRGCRRELLFLTIPVAFFIGVAILSMLNLGIRHVLPIYPFCIILAAAAGASFARRSNPARAAVAALLLLAIASSLHSFPNFLACSNELVGGPSHTYRVVTDANDDWGRGLKWTRKYLDRHPSTDCWFDPYNPLIDPAYFGIHCKPLLTGMGHLIGLGTAPVSSTISGTVLVSSTELDGLLWGPDELNPYRIFRDRAPDAKIENVILVYRGTFDVPLLAAQTNAVAATGLLRRRRLPEALALAQTAVAQAPESAEVNAVLGQALLASGHIAEGEKAMATALHLAQTIHPEFQKALIQQLQRPPGGS